MRTQFARVITAARPRLILQHGWRPAPPWLLITSNGTPYRQSCVRREFHRVLRLAGLPDTLSPHSMRRAFACAHVEARADLVWLQRQLGHSSFKLTADLYARAARVTDPQAANALGAALLGNTAGNSALS
jgi:integrase